MNTVDALNKLGQALLGDSYESKVGLTDAETIESIANQVIAAGGLNPGGGGGSSSGPRVIRFNGNGTDYETGLTTADFLNTVIAWTAGQDSDGNDLYYYLPVVTVYDAYDDISSDYTIYLYAMYVSGINYLNNYNIREFTYNPETGKINVSYAD